MPKRNPSGRPQKLTPELQERICQMLKVCGSLEEVASACGIGDSTLRGWRQRGREEKRGKYPAFLAAVTAAQRERLRMLQQGIVKKGLEDWKANAWLLERWDPMQFAPRIFHHVNEELTNAARKLEAAFANEPEVLERALAAIVGRHTRTEADGDPILEGDGTPGEEV